MKRLVSSLGLSVAVLLLAGSAAAQDGIGIQAGARIGYGFPLGSAMKGAPMGDNLSGVLPIGLDVGYKLTPNIVAGLYALGSFHLLYWLIGW